MDRVELEYWTLRLMDRSYLPKWEELSPKAQKKIRKKYERMFDIRDKLKHMDNEIAGMAYKSMKE